MSTANFIKGIIGDGYLTEIILTAFTRQIGISPNDTYVLASTSGRCQELLEQFNVHAVQNSMVFVPPAKMIILAVEPNDAREIMRQIANKVSDDVLIISVVQGLKLREIEGYFPDKTVIRMIINPWVISGHGVSTYIVGKNHSEEAGNIARALLTSLGEMVEVDSEEELDIVGELILSETVYTFLTFKALMDSGKKAGLSLDKSREIVMKILASSTKAISSSDDLTDSVIQRSYSQSDYIDKGKELLDKYNIMTNFKKSFEEPLEAKDIYKFRYRW